MQDEQQEVTVARGGRAKLVIALTLGLAIGAGSGSLVVGPLIADPAEVDGRALTPEQLEAQCAALFEEWGDDRRAAAPAAVHTIENVVLNPAGSQGTRFLLASVGFGLREAAGAEQMAGRDAEVRDLVIRVLGSRSVTELSEATLRDSIKEEMRDEVTRLLGPDAVLDVYFPQFVIQ